MRTIDIDNLCVEKNKGGESARRSEKAMRVKRTDPDVSVQSGGNHPGDPIS